MSLKVLLVDDHIGITDYYKSELSYDERNFEIKTANTLKDAYFLLFEKNQINIDLAILDVSMPSFNEKQLNDGEDLAKLIKVKFPKAKIIFITGYSTAEKLNSIINNICPEGFIEKVDINSYNLMIMINKIISGNIFRSETILKSIQINSENNYNLDSQNRQIISLIAKGISTKNLQNHLNIKTSAIDKRKAFIKQILGIDFGNDEDIIREAKKRKII